MSPVRFLRKTFLFFLAFLLTAFVFTACGGKDDADEEDTKKTETRGREDLRKGKAAYEIGKYDEAAMSFALAAQDGNAEAMYLLGKCYQDGTGVERNIDKAEQWMKKAADRGYIEAKAAMEAFPDRSIAAADAAGFSGGDRTISLPGNVKLEMVKVEAGSFEMSARDGENSDYEVSHRATLTKDFCIGKTEVTQAQWKAVMGNNPSYFKGDDLPVEKVSWNDAMEFCEKLNDSGKAPRGWKFTLPTETQWEYAARGGRKSKGYKYSGSDKADDVAWYYENSGDSRLSDSSWDHDKLTGNHCKTHPVGQKKANELGLYDMSGNVYEWCLDDYKGDSSELTAEFTRGNDRSGSNRAGRGGCWFDSARGCRSAGRDFDDPGDRGNFLGFRVALVPVQ